MAAHIHADAMRLYSEDALQTDMPWKNWQVFSKTQDEWVALGANPPWSPNRQYRRKPKTIRIGDMEVPEPMKTAPEYGTVYWFPSFPYSETADNFAWSGDDVDNRMLQRGLCHATQEAAEAHAKALIKVSGGEV